MFWQDLTVLMFVESNIGREILNREGVPPDNDEIAEEGLRRYDEGG